MLWLLILNTYLPIFVSSSNSDGDRFVRRHNVAIIPMCNVKQQIKSMISSSNRTPPTATAIIDEYGRIGLSLRITKSLPAFINENFRSDIPTYKKEEKRTQFMRSNGEEKEKLYIVSKWFGANIVVWMEKKKLYIDL